MAEISIHRSHVLLRAAVLLVIAALATSGLAAPAAAKDVLSPLVVEVIAAPKPVLGADRRVHLVYELKLANQSASFVTVNSVQALGPSKPVGGKLAGAGLDRVLRLDGGKEGTLIGPGEGAMIFMDVRFARRATLPRTLRHKFVLSLRDPAALPPGGRDDDPAAIPPTKLSFAGVPTPVSRRKAVVVSPPLRGGKWVVGNGCCATLNAHRGATLSINGTIHVAERFAIDFVQLNAQDRLFDGPVDKNSSYAFFGDKVYSAADGVVVRKQDGLPEQVPGKLPADATVKTAGGNYLVIDIGGGRFAFYAHLQPGSLRFKKGDRVRRGEVIGLLGNTGNSDAAHLHFHIMDGPSPLRSNGLPFVFDSFKGQGVVTDERALVTGGVTPIDRSALAGRRLKALPLNDQLVAFPK